ncbi:MAG: DUF748 domain-containing protein [Chloroherpetonaceae bacterium]
MTQRSPSAITPKRLFFYVGLGLISTTLVIFLVGFLIARAALSSVVKSRLADVVIASTDSLYTLQIDSLLIDSDEIRATKVKLVPFKLSAVQSLSANYEISLDEILISKPKWVHLLNRSIEVERFEIKRPNLVLKTLQENASKTSSSATSPAVSTHDASRTFSENVLEKYVKRFRINSVRIEDASLNYIEGGAKSVKRPDSLVVSLFAENISLMFNDSDSRRIQFDFDDFRFVANPYRRQIPNTLYEVAFNAVYLSVKDSTFSVEDFSFAPAMNDDEFCKHHRYRPTLVKVKFDSLKLHSIDYKRLLFGGEFVARFAELHRLSVYAMTDKRIPNPPRIPDSSLPNEAIAKINTKFHIDSMRIHKSRVVYATRQPFVREGAIRFEAINGLVENASNFPEKMTAKTPLRLHASTRLMGDALVKAELTMPLLSPSFDMTFKAVLSGLDVTTLNHFLEPEARVKLESGTVSIVSVYCAVSNGVGRGKVSPQYNNLRMLVLSEDRRKERGFMEGLKTFVVNRFGVKSENPEKNKPLREATVQYVRKRDESIFEYIWQFIWVGMQKVMT